VNLPAGWLSDNEAATLATLATDKTVLELGAWKGRSTTALASTARLVVSADWHRGDPDAGYEPTLPDYWANVRDLPNVAVVVGDFGQIVPLFASIFDLAFVDGAHDYESVLRDARGALHLTSGLVLFHDYDQPQVQEAVAAVGFKPIQAIDTLAVCPTW